MAFVAVHGGAGNHNPANDQNVKKALRLACENGLSQVDPKQSQSRTAALNIVEHAIMTLEDDEGFNAGFGSNLTLDGTVECDAGIMDDNGIFGSVGAVSGVKNPIRLSRIILEHSQKSDALGRIPPLTLVSEGAKSFGLRHSIPTVPPESLVCTKARNNWTRWKEKYESGESVTEVTEASELQDTVGSVAMCGISRAAGVSSGGILLKYPGRLGEASVFGAGCWAESSQERSVACSVSGAGEYITRTALARMVGGAIACSSEDDDPHDIIYHLLKEEFWDRSRRLGEPHPNVGVLVLTKEQQISRAIGKAGFVLRQTAPKPGKTDSEKPPIFITAYTL
ncbi:hypothetical protein AAF712_004152 [Marasmius tenuissimus]|uniref:Uncharacterized protein n=1 Tax=Marasmius tenuissimus TaxID=585030 RepID=A0ABR3A4D3_9AGAR